MLIPASAPSRRAFLAEPLEHRQLLTASLFPGVQYPVGTGPDAVTAADLNGDGAVDLVTANGSANTVSVLLNAGGGTFAPAVSYAVGTNPVAVVTADLNGDGRPDVVAANKGSATLWVLLNSGTGTFAARASYAIGSNPTSLVAADLNGDGLVDLLVTDKTAGRVTVFRNVGNGTLASAATVAAPGAVSVAAAKFYGGTYPDLVVAESANKLQFFTNSGGFTFTTGTAVTLYASPAAVVATDINGDGKPDVVAPAASGTGYYLLNAGAGTFNGLYGFSDGQSPVAVVATDLDGDGRPDLAVAQGDSGEMQVLTNAQGTQFTTGELFDVGTGLASLAVADLNGDGVPDLVGVSPYANAVTVRMGVGHDSFAFPNQYSLPSSGDAVAVADVNGDGVPDQLSAGPVYGAGPSVDTALEVHAGLGGGVYATPVDYPGLATDASAWGMAAGDLNGDGKVDVVTIATGGTKPLVVYINRGDGTFTPGTAYPAGPGSRTITVADMNGDGRPDVVLDSYSAFASYGTVVIVPGLGDGTFGTPVSYASGSTSVYSATVADFNHDGHPDVAAATGSSVTVLLNRGDGTLGTGTAYPVTTASIAIATADLNGDGYADLVTGSAGVSVLLNAAGGTFAAATAYASVPAVQAIAVGDVDGDGRPDVVAAGVFGGTSLFLDQAGGALAAPTRYYTPGTFGVAVADINGDGKPDIAVPAAGLTLLFNQSPSATPAPAFATRTTGGLLSVSDALAGGTVTLSQAGATVTAAAATGSYTFPAASVTAIQIAGWMGEIDDIRTTTALSAPVRIQVGGSGGHALTVSGGAVDLSVGPPVANGYLTLNLNSTANLAAPVAGSGETAAPINLVQISAGGTLRLGSSANPSVDRTLLALQYLSLPPGATIDLGANDLATGSYSLPTLPGQVATGAAGGRWTGTGVTSSSAAADPAHLHALGVVANLSGTAATYPTFDGIVFSNSEVLVKYTLYGDTNLDGVVTAADYTRVDAGYVAKLTGWANGDVNYDGVVDGSDYSLVDNAFNQQSAAPAAAAAGVAVPTAEARVAATPTLFADSRPGAIAAAPMAVGASVQPASAAFFWADDRRDRRATTADEVVDLLR